MERPQATILWQNFQHPLDLLVLHLTHGVSQSPKVSLSSSLLTDDISVAHSLSIKSEKDSASLPINVFLDNKPAPRGSFVSLVARFSSSQIVFEFASTMCQEPRSASFFSCFPCPILHLWISLGRAAVAAAAEVFEAWHSCEDSQRASLKEDMMWPLRSKRDGCVSRWFFAVSCASIFGPHPARFGS
jgi:hypothetical protein